MADSRHANWLIALTIFLALVLSVWPLPEWAVPYRPIWLPLVAIYWCMALPERFGLGVAWLSGVMLDAVTGSLLGEHALALTIVVFFTLRKHLQIRIFPLWQQTLAVAILLFIYQFIPFWIDGMLGYTTNTTTNWLPILPSIVLWPWVMQLLRQLRRRYRVS